jgi:hypothetical protein
MPETAAARIMCPARNAAAFEVPPGHVVSWPAGGYRFIFYADAPHTPAGIMFGCPCGCGAGRFVHFQGEGRGHTEWAVAGQWPKVTMTPMIGLLDDTTPACQETDPNYHWHGWLINGMFLEA